MATATSPYLLQHAENPVDWYPWGEEAFEEARRRDVPLLISIGYAACHWCHVMAHESFEDPETAALMNEQFVCVKVDREERPDVDAVYMAATQTMTGGGGWPMTVFATPEGKPFQAGTYYPPVARHGLPSFRQLLVAVGRAWGDIREDVLRAGDGLVAELEHNARVVARAEGVPGAEVLGAAVGVLLREFDAERGGFGGAPKFPPSMTVEHLLRHHARTGEPAALAMAQATCVAMARGGIYDQLGGGFARYAVDAEWVVPHFEKMLYDNALLLRVYLHLWRATGDELALRVVHETADWMLRELWLVPDGGFASSLDADTDGVEGKFYAWDAAQLVEVLGEEDGAWAASLFAVTPEGTFEHGLSVLQLLQDPDDVDRHQRVRTRLFDVRREQRTAPGRDDKAVAAWNGLAIAAFAEAGALVGRPELVHAARQTADMLERVHWDGKAKRLTRTSRDGVAGQQNPGVLEDYADVAEGLLALYAVTGETRWYRFAGELLDVVLEEFRDETGLFFDTASDSEALIFRPADPTDNATPGGTSAAAGALLTYAALTGSGRHREAAEQALRFTGALAERAPRFAGWGLAVAEALEDGPREVAIVAGEKEAEKELEKELEKEGEKEAAKASGEEAGKEPGKEPTLHQAALASTAPGLVIAVTPPPGDTGPTPELLSGRPAIDGEPTAYVCRGFVCQAPTTELSVLSSELA
ncbi:thioredoxin domain-containing protein [Catenulispora yoronensis]|uniref:Thioredoxin domain-containing protein n=1 Tax=Catenulispora yoronensis TaxID=450799 RepID=A0ABP5GMH8_9ACTN